MPPLSKRCWEGVFLLPEMLEQYLGQIGEQIRWKRARPVLIKELTSHALEQMDACLEEGLSQEDAEAETLRQMGDPVEIGQELDRIHRPKPQWGMLILTGVLALLGTILPVVLLSEVDAVTVHPGKLALLAVLGFGALFVGYFANYVQLIRHSVLIYWGSVVSALLLLIVSPIVNQKSYYTHYVTMLYPLVYALLLCRLKGKGWRGLFLAILALGPLMFPSIKIPEFRDALTVLVSGGVLLILAAKQNWFGIDRKKGLICIAGVLLAGSSIFVWEVHRRVQSRLYSVLHPEEDPLGRGYLCMSIRSALTGAKPWGTGEMTGQWAGQSFYHTVPGTEDDTFLVTVIHNLGWLPFLLLCGALLTLLIWAFVKMLRQKNSTAKFLVVSVLFILGVNILFSLLLAFGYAFIIVSCPFLKMSAETILNMGLMGFLLSVFRQETLPFNDVMQKPKQPKGKWKLVYVPVEG